MNVINLAVRDLKPYERNTKKHDAKQISNVAQSIREYGFVQPIVVDRENVVIIGHCRLAAAKRLGMETVPCYRAEDLTPEQVNALRIVDNKTNESEWDMDALAHELQEVDLGAFDFEWTVPEPKPEVEEDGYEPEPPVQPMSRLGDLVILGDHRLLVGDATKAADVQRLMKGEKAAVFLTDPPYGVDYEGGTGLKIENDNLADAAFEEFLDDAFSAADTVLERGAAFYIWHADSRGLIFRLAAAAQYWEIRQVLIWVKNSFVLGRQDYQWQHEPCLYGWTPGAGHYFTPDRTEATVLDDGELDISKMSKAELKDTLLRMLADTPTSVIRENKPARNAEHPTMKPLKLLAHAVRNSSKPGEIVLDTFAGSGSTMMTCEQMRRRARVMELDPRYADVIVDRWCRFTGETASLLTADGPVEWERAVTERAAAEREA